MAILAQLKDSVVVHRFELNKSSLSLGRLPDNDICIDSDEVSSHHAVIERSDDDTPQYFIVDQGSTNKTFVNEQAISRTRLYHEDVIRIGWIAFKFMDENSPDHRKTKKIRKSWIPGVYYTR